MAQEKVSDYIEKAQEVYVTYRLWHHDPYDLSKKRELQEKEYNKQFISIHTTETFHLEQQDNQYFKIETTYYHYEAYVMRKKTSTQKKINNLKQNYEEYYNKYYQNVILENLEINDKKDSLVIIEKYKVDDCFTFNEEVKQLTLKLLQTTIIDSHTILNTSLKNNPLKYPNYVKIDRDVFLPSGIFADAENEIIENDFFYFEFNEQYDENNYKLSQYYIYQVKQNQVEKIHYNTYIEGEDEIYFSYNVYNPNSNTQNNTNLKKTDLKNL